MPSPPKPASTLHHIPLGLTRYLTASTLQAHLVRRLLDSKALGTPSPPPTVITATFHPTYTLGRRERHLLTPSLRSRLSPAEVHFALRGGQTTFHGPGQLVAYPVIDLRTHGLSPRCYVRLLEEAVIAAVARYRLAARVDEENPGVWTAGRGRKLASVGVHMRRNVTSHGVAVNVDTDMGWWEKIVACGLEGVEMTSLRKEGVGGPVTVERVGKDLVSVFAERLAAEVVVRGASEEELRPVNEGDVM